MTIPAAYKSRLVYHMTHIDNLPSILKHGLLSKNTLVELGIDPYNIAYDDIQERRADTEVTCGPGETIHDYVPLYFCTLSLMLLAVINKKKADEQFIIYLAFPISILEKYPAVFTNAAANTVIPPTFYDDPKRLAALNWDAIDCCKWSMPSDELKQARMAELLVHEGLDVSMLSHVVVWNESIGDYVSKQFKEAGLNQPQRKYGDYRFYFLDFLETKRLPIVTGPYFIGVELRKTVKELTKELGKAVSPAFASLRDLRDGLRRNFCCLREMAEIEGLEPDNPVHYQHVGAHTRTVVDTLKRLPEYQMLTPGSQVVVEIAAFLHDIGKGPKARWQKSGGKQQVDLNHSLRAMPMLTRILSQEVAEVDAETAALVCKLVCYHDLVGDIIGKGRMPQELEEVVESEEELDMLIALSRADVQALDELWWDDAKVRTLKAGALKAMKNRNRAQKR